MDGTNGFWFVEHGIDRGFGFGESPEEAWFEVYSYYDPDPNEGLPPDVLAFRARLLSFDGGRSVYLPKLGIAAIQWSGPWYWGSADEAGETVCLRLDGRRYSLVTGECLDIVGGGEQ